MAAQPRASCPEVSLDSLLKSKTLRLKDLKGKAVQASLSQAGSRYLQSELPKVNQKDFDIFCAEIEPELSVIMGDVFGNYIVQKIIERGVTAPI